MTSRSVKTVCPYCGVGCGMVLTVEQSKVVKLAGDKTHPTNFGRLCTKGSTSAQALRESGRLDAAYLRSERAQEPARTAMDHAISETARRLRALLGAHGPDALSFYVSGQMSLESQYLINKLAKGYVGTNNIDSNSRLCMSSAASGYKLSLGSDGPPGSYQDFDRADVFFVIGANMADCHPILFLRLLDRRKAGAKLIVVDPRRNTTAEKADLFLQIRPGTDLVLLNGLLHLIVENGHIDADFIARFTEGWEAMPAFLRDYPPTKVAQLTGIPEADLRKAAQWIGEAGEWMSCWTMGLNQSTHGTWNTNAICNLHLATGAICRPGSGPFSLTGQPNAMGGREVGYLSLGLPGQRTVTSEADRRFIEQLWDVPAGRIQPLPGPDTVTMFRRMAAGEIKACWIICTNPIASVANRDSVIAALKMAELVIAQDAFLETETNRYADILLPGALWAEGEGVMINSERNLTLMQKAIEPPGEALPDWQIIARVACEMGFAEGFSYASAAEVFDEIRRTFNPKTGYDIRGISHERLRETPVQWPCPPDASDDRHPIRYLNDGTSQTLKQQADGTSPRLLFATASGKAQFIARPHLDPAELPDEGFPFVLNTGRLPHQWHTMTKTGKVPALNKLNPGPFVELHPEDAKALGITELDKVEVRSRRGRAVLPAVITPRVLAGNCFTTFHWNDVFGEALAINAVTNDAVDALSMQPEFKFCAVALTRVAPEEAPVTLLDELRGLPASGALAAETEAAGGDLAVALAPLLAKLRAPAQTAETTSVEAVAAILQLPPQAPPALGPDEQAYVAGFLHGLKERKDRGVPMLPPQAPLPPNTRLWINGLLAGLFGEAAAGAAPAGSSKPAVRLLWASQTGNAEGLAQKLASGLGDACSRVSVTSMADYPTAQLADEGTLLLLSSTYGDGEAPDNGQAFWEFLNSDTAPRLDRLRYAVLALGDPSYDQFCGHGRKLDERLAALGATRLLDRRDCDTDYHVPAEDWLAQLRSRLADAPAAAAQHAVVAAAAQAAQEDIQPSKTRPYASRLLGNQRLNAVGSSKETRSFSLDLGDSGLRYEAGDALGVIPTNCPALVAELLALTKLKAERPVTVAGLGEASLEEALLRHYEISRPTPEALRFIAQRSGAARLKSLLHDDHKAQLKDWLWNRQLADLLHEHPVTLSADELLGLLKRLQPRLYSISSSPKAHPGEVHLTVAAVRYRSARAERKGLCSTFLADRAASGSVPVFVQRSPHFRPPADPGTAMIMVGPGTGVAPFRGFLQERRALGATGRNWLFFGEQRSASDFYYADELQALRKDGLLSRLSLAFSRDQPEKVYVQDRMREYGTELWTWLQEGAHFYVCGDASRMAKDVDQALREIAQQHGRLTEQQAREYLQGLAKEKRYLRDVY